MKARSDALHILILYACLTDIPSVTAQLALTLGTMDADIRPKVMIMRWHCSQITTESAASGTSVVLPMRNILVTHCRCAVGLYPDY